MSSTDGWILWRSPQSLARQPYVVSGAEVSVLGVDIDAISAYPLRVTPILLLVLLGLGNQVFSFVVWIPADPVQEGKAVPHGNTDLGAKLNSSSSLTTDNRSNMSLNQVDNAVGHAAAFGVQQDALLAVQLADHEQLVPPVSLQGRKACARRDQSIDGIEITLQVVELTTYRDFYSAAAWLFLLGNTEEVGTCLAAVISGFVFA